MPTISIYATATGIEAELADQKLKADERSYTQTINLVTGDTLPELSLTLRDANTAASGRILDSNDEETWAPINIEGATVRLKIRKIGAVSLSATLTFSVTDGKNGKVVTNWPAGTLTEAGTFEAEIEITFVGGGIQTIHDLLKLKVKSDFD